MATQAILGKVVYRGSSTGARKYFSDCIFVNGVKQAIKSAK